MQSVVGPPEPLPVPLPTSRSVWPAPRAAYVHVPFCLHRCGYCNFTVVAQRDDLVESYLEAIERELSWLESPRPVDTLFLGGGTPTHLSPPALARLLTIVRHWFELSSGYEFSVEANPADLDAERMGVLAEFGVTRISLGVQSFRAEKLELLERDHRQAEIERSYELARRHAASVSIDLIFGVPHETLSQWQSDLASTLALRPDHVSTYGLTYERGTTFWNRLAHGSLVRLDEELERQMFAAAIDTLAAAGIEQYEVSNFARPGHRCRHNEVYWAAESYYAAGPGAARYVAGRREINHRSPTTYLKRVLSGRSPVAEAEELPPEDRAREALVLGLRRMAGVERDDFQRRTGFSLDTLAGEALAKHLALGLLADDGRHVRLTRSGLFVSDSIWSDLLRV
jgi:oxygen-independent coproporphyrinogen-3 oxidase